MAEKHNAKRKKTFTLRPCILNGIFETANCSNICMSTYSASERRVGADIFWFSGWLLNDSTGDDFYSLFSHWPQTKPKV